MVNMKCLSLQMIGPSVKRIEFRMGRGLVVGSMDC